MNGEPFEKILDRIEDHVLRVEEKIDKINSQGCAQRPNDIARIGKLEDWKETTTSKFIGGLFAIIAALVTSLYNLFRH